MRYSRRRDGSFPDRPIHRKISPSIARKQKRIRPAMGRQTADHVLQAFNDAVNGILTLFRQGRLGW
jgi:hypothetical protein